jgi:hypothetical protein
MDDFLKVFKEFTGENLKVIRHPSQNHEISFSDLNQLCDLLFRFINYEVREASLARIKENFVNHFLKIQELNLNEISNAIEGLATNFEPFLKKIALVRFPGNENWNGDLVYCGINKTTLDDLLNSRFSFKDYRNVNNHTVKEFPDALINYKGISRAILDFVRQSLRNAVHEAKDYNRVQKIQYSNYVIAIYLIAVNDNKQFLQRFLYPEYAYLENIIKNKTIRHINSVYIDLLGKEEDLFFDSIVIEKLDGDRLMEMIDNFNIDEEPDEDDDIATARVDTISNIAKDTNNFIIIGEPGSGKTTSLSKIQFDNALGLINGTENSKFPVLIKASSYSAQNNYEVLLNREINFTNISELSKKYNVIVLIDGLNEIDLQYRAIAYKDILNMITFYSDISFVLSTRKHGFNNIWNIPVFELKDLNSKQIEQLITNVVGVSKGKTIWEEIKVNDQLLDLSQKPLLLMMIIQVAKLNNGIIPKNKGLLYKIFNDGIFSRESKVYSTDIETKNDILSFLAFWMRENGLFKNINRSKCKSIIESQLKVINTTVGVNNIINELIDNGFLKVENDDLEFYHETHQEYFVALQLKKSFETNQKFNFNYSEEKWFEAILICNDLFTNSNDRMRLFEFLFIGEKYDTPKRLYEFCASDIDENFIVACKIAYSTQFSYPEIFKKAEIYLNNYLILWSYKNSLESPLIGFDKILKAVAALSSPYLFHKVVLTIKYNCNWLYFPNVNTDEYDDFQVIKQKFNENFELHTRAFVENLSDFTAYYECILSSNIGAFNLWSLRSIYSNIGRLNSYILKNASSNKLISAFFKFKDEELLNEIAKTDLDFLISNYNSIEEYNLKNTYKLIIKHHIYNPTAIAFVKKNLLAEKISLKFKINILYEMLSISSLLDYILSSIVTLEQNPEYQNEIILNQKVLRELLKEIPLKILIRYNLSKYFAVPLIAFKELDYYILKQSEQSIVFLLPYVDMNSLREAHKYILVNNSYVDCQIESNHKDIMSGETENSTKLICYFDNSKFEKINSIKLLTADVNFSDPSLYHSDILINNINLLRYVEGKIYANNTKKFIHSVGIESSFLKYSDQIGYSVILKVIEKPSCTTYVTYHSVKNKIVSFNSYFNNDNVNVNDIVFVEQNNRVIKLDNALLKNIKYHKSIVLDYDLERQEGFIKNIKSVETSPNKDYYFSLIHCNFSPKIGDEVNFLPGLNHYRKYFLKPAAYCISKSPDNIAILKTYFLQKDYYNLYLADKVTNEEYFCRILISDFDKYGVTKLEKEMAFTFRFPKKSQDGLFKKKIFIIKKLPTA